MEGHDKRRTTRINAGIGPPRFGAGEASVTSRDRSRERVPPVNSSSNQEEVKTPTRKSPSVSGRSVRSLNSFRSTRSHSSAIRHTEVELQVEEQIAVLDEAYDQNLRALKQLEFEVKMLVDIVESIKRQQTSLTDEIEIQHTRVKLEKAEEEWKLKADEVEKRRIDLEFEANSLQRKKSLLLKRGDLDKRIIDEEDGDNSSQHLSEDDDILSDTGTTTLSRERVILQNRMQQQARVAEEALQRENNSSRRRLTSDGSPPSPKTPRTSTLHANEHTPEDIALLERFRRLRDDPISATANTAAPTNPQGSSMEAALTTIPHNPVARTPPVSATDQLAEVLTRAFERMSGQSNNAATDKFLARQVHGKDLPIFSGRPEEWVTFITCYQSTTTACRYDDTDNLIRLQKCLRGEAMKTVQCLMSTPNNVNEIIKILKLRFGQPEHIVDALVEKAKYLSAFREDRLDCLIEFGTAVKNLTATIISLNCVNHLNNPTLLKELEQKLPVSLRMRWMTWVEEDSLRSKDLRNFCKWMEMQTNAACRLCPPKAKTDDRDQKKGQPGQWRDRRRDDHVLVANDNEHRRTPAANEAFERKCQFCRKPGHLMVQCRNFAREDIDSRWKWIRDNRHCFGCLQYGHGMTNCRNKKVCGTDHCEKSHHPLLHKVRPEAAPETVAHASGHAEISSQINFLILPVQLKGPAGCISTFAMLDNGSTVTLLDAELADRLGLDGENKPLQFGGLHPTVNVPDSKSVNLEIATADGRKKYSLKNVRTTSYLPLPRQSVRKSLLNKWTHLKKLDIKSYENAEPKMLIGLDNAELIMPREFITGPPNSPCAARTELGWILCGRWTESIRPEFISFIHHETEDELHKLVKEYFSTDSFGVRVTQEKPRCKEDRYAQRIMDATIKRVGDHWESGLLWRNENIQLPSSKSVALTRLFQMERKMDRSPEFAELYAAKIQEYVDKGFAKMLTPKEAEVEPPRTFYLPHFMAKNPKKPKKLRFVFDAAAKVNGTSLNDALLIGPDQLTSMPSVLFKFRQRRIAITADIQDMFHRVQLKKEDTSAQRFLWRGMARNREPSVYEMGVLIFGASCSPACAQEAKNKNAKEFIDEYPEAVKAIIERHYVDDYLDSCDSVVEAVTRFQEVYKVHQHGSFNICKWIASDEEVLLAIPEDLRASGDKNISESNNQIERVLGLFWRPVEDYFTFSLSFLKAKEEVINNRRLPTKREVLALAMSIYDPLGFLSMFSIRAKIMLQEIWRTRIGWDDDIPTTLQEKWKSWLELLTDIPSFKIPRCYSLNFSKADCLQLHVFCDASEQAFGAVAYFRVVKGEQIEVTLPCLKQG